MKIELLTKSDSADLNLSENQSIRLQAKLPPEIRQPYLHDSSGLWVCGNVRLIDCNLACIESYSENPAESELFDIELLAQEIVLSGQVLVTGIHCKGHRRAACVPLRWGGSRIVVLPGGFRYHLGQNLDQEPFREARLWRYQWDPNSDLVVSRRAPYKLPTFENQNESVGNLIKAIVSGEAWFPKYKCPPINQQSLFD